MTKSAWSHAAIYVGYRLKDSEDEGVKSILNGLDATDRQYLLIEADAGKGVIVVPLNNYKDYNIRICRTFGLSPEDLNVVIADVTDNLGNHYDHENLTDLALLLLPSFLNPFRKRTIQACLGGFNHKSIWAENGHLPI